MDFIEVYERFKRDIAASAHRQNVPGLDYDDVVSEMTACLWRAWKTFAPGKGRFEVYWWSVWLNHKGHLIQSAYRLKRPKTVLVENHFENARTYGLYLRADPPKGCSDLERLVWTLIGSGESGAEIRRITGIPVRAYYRLLRSWRTAEVKESLIET